MEFSLAQTPSNLLLQLGLTLFIWLRFNFISLLNRSCINMMFLCTKKSLTRTQRSLPVLHVFVLPDLLTQVLPGQVTPYLISYTDTHPDFYPRLCPIAYPSRYPAPYPSHTRACYPDFYPRLCPIPYPSCYLEPYPSRTRACYPEL
jgi:hypothetical protein